MKKVKASRRRVRAKAKIAPKNVDEYLASVPKAARANLSKMRAAIRSAVPAEATETISYGIPAFKHKRVLVWFGGFAKHCSLFPTASVIETFKKELNDFTTSKGTIQFPNDKPVPAGLIKKLAKARAAQSESKRRG